MNICTWEPLPCCLDKTVDETVVLLSPHSFASETKIQLVFKQLLVLHRKTVSDRQFIAVEMSLLKLTSVPQSRTTGNCLAGWIPAQTVVKTSFATDMRIPPTPWSPIPRICRILVNISVNVMKSNIPSIIGIYLFPISHNNIIDIVCLSASRQTLFDNILIEYVQENTFRLTKEPGVVLYCFSFRGCIYHTEHLFQVRLKKLGV